MLGPVDADLDEARAHRPRTGPTAAAAPAMPAACRHRQLEHHDGDDDRDHAVGEGGQALGGHRFLSALSLETPIGDQPHDRHADVDRDRDATARRTPAASTRRKATKLIISLAPPPTARLTTANPRLRPRISARSRSDRRWPRRRSTNAERRDRQRRDPGLIDPADHQREQRQPEQERVVGPQHAAGHLRAPTASCGGGCSSRSRR